MRAQLAEIHRVTHPVWKEDCECPKSDYRSLSERDQLVAWYAYEVIFYSGLVEDKPVEDALDAAVLSLAKDGYHYPEHLVKYAHTQASNAYYKALRKGEPDELVDSLAEHCQALYN